MPHTYVLSYHERGTSNEMRMQDSIFTKIINREIPAHFLYEDDICVVILDAFPAVPGQSLVIPKVPTAYIYDLDDSTYLHICTIAKRAAKALDTALDAARTCTVVEGFEVPHVHIKLYPVATMDTPLGQILPQGTAADTDELKALADKIKPLLDV